MKRDIANTFVLSLVVLSALFLLRSEDNRSAPDQDRLQWLEELNGTKALDWVNKENNRVKARLLDSAVMKDNEQIAIEIIKSYKTVVTGKIIGQYVFSLMPSSTSSEGSWKRIRIEDYINHKDKWEEILNIDAYNLRTGINHRLTKAHCMAPDFDLCLLHFSDAGSDAVNATVPRFGNEMNLTHDLSRIYLQLRRV
ncbi:MAG: hypothetical protein EOP04_04345 [Proteobacteria bacterium]|nr:MAG: hypothetical protein EOP04_04345 [Pseudomonadota bacterium]